MTVAKTVPELKKFIENGGTVLTIGSSTAMGYHMGLPIKDAGTFRLLAEGDHGIRTEWEPHALTVILEMPGVEKSNVSISVEDGVLSVEGRLDLSKYQGLQPLYTEYNIGHYSRSFRLSSKIDQSKIAAEMKDGVLSLQLPKVEQAKPRTIQIN